MGYKSQAQAAYFNKNRSSLEAQGVDVDEWNAASKGLKLPKRVKPTKLKTKGGKLGAQEARLNKYLGNTYGKA